MSIPTKITLYPNNDTLLTLTGLQDVLTMTFLNGALVTATLYDQQGNQVTGLVNVSMSNVTGSNGDYRAAVPAFSYGPPPDPDHPIIGGFNLQVTAAQGGVQMQLNIPTELDLRRK